MIERLFVVVCLTTMAWVLPAAHAMPLDADGPSGLSDNEDFDDLIVSLTSPTAAVSAALVNGAATWSMPIGAVVLPASDLFTYVVVASAESRAPPVV